MMSNGLSRRFPVAMANEKTRRRMDFVRLVERRAVGADLLDDLTGLVRWQVPHQAVAIKSEHRSEHHSIGGLRRRLQIGELGGGEELGGERRQRPSFSRTGTQSGAAHGVLVCLHELWRARKPRKGNAA
jgi:hypothetical protein